MIKLIRFKAILGATNKQRVFNIWRLFYLSNAAFESNYQ